MSLAGGERRRVERKGRSPTDSFRGQAEVGHTGRRVNRADSGWEGGPKDGQTRTEKARVWWSMQCMNHCCTEDLL